MFPSRGSRKYLEQVRTTFSSFSLLLGYVFPKDVVWIKCLVNGVRFLEKSNASVT